METAEKTENNNQKVTSQNSIDAKQPKELFVSISNGRSGISSRIMLHHQKPKYSNYPDQPARYRLVSELCLNGNWSPCSKEVNSSDEPIDLTCSEKRQIKTRNINSGYEIPMSHHKMTVDVDNRPSLNFMDLQRVQSVKRRGRRRKYENRSESMTEETETSHTETPKLKPCDNANYFQIADNKQAEVIKAAKSLFSKRTRTLYHWMYPSAPKTQLKAAVASSWETLGAQEKEFYISQVLGRFGFPQTNLMVNPQLGGMTGAPPLPLLDLSTTNNVGNEETSTAVSTLLMSEHRNATVGSWAPPVHQKNLVDSLHYSAYSERIHKKRGRLGRPPGSKSKKQIKEEIALLKQIREDPAPEEFQDDPELNQEFQQFKWTLHLNDNEKP